jgi:hypothetical protein
MNKLGAVAVSDGEAAESVTDRDSSPSMQSRRQVSSEDSRLIELEIENSRLHRLVAELLIKNQQLRKAD